MSDFLKSKKESMLWVAAITLFIMAAFYAVYEINYLGRSLNDALSEYGSGESPVTRFDFDKLNQVLSGKPAIPTPTP